MSISLLFTSIISRSSQLFSNLVYRVAVGSDRNHLFQNRSDPIRFSLIRLAYCLIGLKRIGFSKNFASASAIGSEVRPKMLPSAPNRRTSVGLPIRRGHPSHIQNKINIISDALSRLASSNGKKEIEKNVLTAMTIFVYFIMIVHMTDEFKTKIISNYTNHYLKIIDFIIANNELDFYTTSFFYVFKRNLLYYKNFKKKLRLCIFDNMIKKIFEQSYDQSKHFGFVVTYKRIIENFYIFKLSKKLCDYIKNCSQCELNQTFCHLFYETLQSIINFSKSFHIITINFIIALFESKKNKFDCVISMIDKFSKTVIFITNYIVKSDKW